MLTLNMWLLSVTLSATPATDPNHKKSGQRYAQPVSTVGANAGHHPNAHGTGLCVGAMLLRAEHPVLPARAQDVKVAR